MVDVCAGIVTFNPDVEILKQNITNIIQQVRCIVLFDNGSSNINEINNIVSDFCSVYLIKESKNMGIAYALNRLCGWAEQNGFEWILTLDQDSISPCNLVDCLCKYIDEKVAIISPNIVYKGNEKHKVVSSQKSEEVEWTITSASLTNIEVWKKLEGFDEWLFIDGVDYDYGVRANQCGYKVIRTYESELLHELGKLKCVVLFGKTIYVTNHSAIRKYYMSRNAIYLRKKLKKGKPFCTITKYILKTAFFENEKKSKISSILHGVVDGLKSI